MLEARASPPRALLCRPAPSLRGCLLDAWAAQLTPREHISLTAVLFSFFFFWRDARLLCACAGLSKRVAMTLAVQPVRVDQPQLTKTMRSQGCMAFITFKQRDTEKRFSLKGCSRLGKEKKGKKKKKKNSSLCSASFFPGLFQNLLSAAESELQRETESASSWSTSCRSVGW
jgi:hypothetical protein